MNDHESEYHIRDHEKRIRHLERVMWCFMGATVALQFLPAVESFLNLMRK